MEGKILIVDDDRIIVESCKRVLQSTAADLEITVTTSSVVAVDLITNNEYDVVVTDIMMPEIDGFELIKRIKEVRPATGIVVITGYPNQQSIQDAIQMGIIDYLPKPFTPTVLYNTVSKAIEVARKLKTFAPEPSAEEETKAKSDEIKAIINRYKRTPGSLITVLAQTQTLIGYLPPSVQRLIAKGLKLPVSEVHSVVSFYPYFTMKVRGKHNIKVCVGAACYAKRANEILAKLKDTLQFNEDNVTQDRLYSYEEVRCLGACGFAAVVEIDHDTHGAVEPEGINTLLKKYN
ncbi:MAG: NAD(P)H-dependent oxidoreductase subunit E [Nitrospirae bacterium]|nr:NAD(P)H-dependent oxidoreductase subunit E [Nitrospirota bacterium]